MKLDDVIHGNDISTYGMMVMDNFKLLSVVITTQRKIDLKVFIRKQFLNNENIDVSSRTYY